jgi:prephenate dehydratase
MGKVLAEVATHLAEPTVEVMEPEQDVFTEAQAMQSCMKFLMANAKNMGLDETVSALAEVILAVDKDLRRFCN